MGCSNPEHVHDIYNCSITKPLNLYTNAISCLISPSNAIFFWEWSLLFMEIQPQFGDQSLSTINESLPMGSLNCATDASAPALRSHRKRGSVESQAEAPWALNSVHVRSYDIISYYTTWLYYIILYIILIIILYMILIIILYMILHNTIHYTNHYTIHYTNHYTIHYTYHYTIHYTTLYYIILHYTKLYYIILHSTIL